jgi:hypothetical protein
MGEGLNFEAARREMQEKEKMRDRVMSLRGMILKGGEQGESAKKVLIREFGQQALGLIVELQREAKKKKK